MKKFNFAANAENKFKVVRYFPTLDMVKEDLFNMYNNNWGYCDLLKEIIEKEFVDIEIDELFNSDILSLTLMTLLRMESSLSFNFYYGIQNLESGEVFNRFYKKIFSYHPDQGYVLFEQDCDRDFASGGADPVFRLISLRSGEEFDQYFVDKKFTTGINNYKFMSYSLNTMSLNYYVIDPVTEELKIDTVMNYPCPPSPEWNVSQPTSKQNLANLHYNIEWVDLGTPFFETEVYKELLVELPEVKILSPYEK
jgi:hypothetical protein